MSRENRKSSYEHLGLTKSKSPSKQLPQDKYQAATMKHMPSLVFDEPMKILGLRMGSKGLLACIQWEQREDKVILAPTWHYTSELKKHSKIAKMLLNYYESQVDWN
eukprot:TRINITY_DN19641_c0_g1_i1.p2 TRINITY_DN19641_c0_g1~~TRINITY_DN19641_c0_g1_i1.p2  ORF type:complete len:106 (+),score=12.30 TRINITY_DN19641_c0_g1_i1:169-486(+)